MYTSDHSPRCVHGGHGVYGGYTEGIRRGTPGQAPGPQKQQKKTAETAKTVEKTFRAERETFRAVFEQFEQLHERLRPVS